MWWVFSAHLYSPSTFLNRINSHDSSMCYCCSAGASSSICQWIHNAIGKLYRGNTVRAATVHFLTRTVQFRKYLTNNSSDSVRNIGKEKKSKLLKSFSLYFFWTWQSWKAKRQCILFELQGWRAWGEQKKSWHFFLRCSVSGFLT